MNFIKYFLFTFLIIFASESVFAAGQLQQIRQQRAVQQATVQREYQRRMQQQVQAQAIARRQAQVAQYQQQQVMAQRVALERQRAIQQAAVQRAAQQRAVQQVAYQRAAQQQAVQQAAVSQAVQQRAIAQSVAQRQAQQYVAAKQVQQGVMAREVMNAQVSNYVNNVAKARAAATAKQAVAYQRAAVEKNLTDYQRYQKTRSQLNEQDLAQRQAREIAEFEARKKGLLPPQAIDPQIVDIKDLWSSLDQKASAWHLIVDNHAKVLTVKHYLDQFKERGVTIKKPPAHYVKMIDSMTQDDPSMLQVPFMNMLSILAVMEYDFDNGQHPDKLAREMLGNGMYEYNLNRRNQ